MIEKNGLNHRPDSLTAEPDSPPRNLSLSLLEGHSFQPGLSTESAPTIITPPTHLLRSRSIKTPMFNTPKSLPLPELAETLGTLTQMASLSTDQNATDKMLTAVQDFQKTAGTKLQAQLEDTSSISRGWLSPLWDSMYLESRDAIPVNVSFAMELNATRWRTGDNHQRLASAILAIHDHYQCLHTGKLLQDMERGQMLCMDQVCRLFSNRKAVQGRDHLTPCQAQHIIILHHGQMYKQVIADSHGNRVSQCHLATLLQDLHKKERSGTTDLTPLTAVNRDDCAKVQNQLLQRHNKHNQVLMKNVDDALFFVCLDENNTPINETNGSIVGQFLAGNGFNRWFDKSLQLILRPDGRITVNIEHTPADAGAWFPLFQRITDWINNEQPSIGHLPPQPEPLNWQTNDALMKSIEQHRKCFQAAINQVAFAEIQCPGMGPDALKTLDFCPDAFYQLVFQVAGFDAWGGALQPTYESVSMRHFAFGRTECLRGCSAEARELAESLACTPFSTTHRKQLLKDAENAHKEKIKACKKGKGLVRHLFALEKTWKSMGKTLLLPSRPALFDDPLYIKLIRKNTLSTSCAIDPNISRFVFGPVEKDGLGIAYYPKKDKLRMTLSWHRDNATKALAFMERLQFAMVDLKALLETPQVVTAQNSLAEA